ncbi:MAG: acyl-CoA dehydrogenase family protein, partial [Polyangiaceae bacterium]
MISFEPSEEQQLIQQSVADLAKSALAPRVREAEKARAVAEDVRRSAYEMGIGLMSLPEACGGQGLGLVASVLVEEELGAADAAAAFGLPGPGAFGRAVLELGTEAQAETLLADFGADGGESRFGAVAWSEPGPCKERAGFVTIAAKIDGGYLLRGKKAFVTNAHAADRFLVFAQLDPQKGWGGIGAFVVRKDNPGLAVGARHDTLGLDAADFGEISLNDALVTEDDRLLGGDDFTRAALRFFAKQALVVAARAVGVARFAFEIAREHCDTRKAFGKPIGHFQAVAFALSDRHMDVESARW